MENVDERRLRIWSALSTLFLATEVGDNSFDDIARAVIETGYRPTEMQLILWSEVYPVLEANLRSVAGEWAGWTDAWLLENMNISSESLPLHGSSSIIQEIRRCWAKVVRRLPPAYAGAPTKDRP